MSNCLVGKAHASSLLQRHVSISAAPRINSVSVKHNGLVNSVRPSAVSPARDSSVEALSQYEGIESRAVGCLVGAMCGDVLAFPAHGQKSHRTVREFPRGLTEMYRFSYDHIPGRYTGMYRQLLAVAKCLAAEQTDSESFSRMFAEMFDYGRTYLPYDRLCFTVLNLNLVFLRLRSAILAALLRRNIDTTLVDHKAMIYWFREYVDIFGDTGSETDAFGKNDFDYLGLDEVLTPDSAYREYQQKLTSRTLAVDPLGLNRFSALVTTNADYVQYAAADFANYVASNFEQQYFDVVGVRGYMRTRLQASPEAAPVLSWMWATLAEALRLPAAISTIPNWWFKRFFNRAGDPETQDVGIVEELLGSSHTQLARRLQQELAIYEYSYTTFTRLPGGPHDCGAASRAAPVGLAMRDADVPQLRACLQQVLLCSHPESTSLDAATVVAAAVQWLSRADAGAEGRGPQALLAHLLDVAGTSEMRGKLLVVRDNLVDMGQVADWRDAWGGPQWYRVQQVYQWCSQRGFATKAEDSVAVALLCLCSNWQQPRQAIETAAHLGGWACVSASIAGALAGALHGTSWIPSSWWEAIESGEEGRDMVVQLGQRLAVVELGGAASGSDGSADSNTEQPWYL